MNNRKDNKDSFSKKERHELIREIISENEPLSQRSIEYKLNIKLGKINETYKVSHATVVRDLRELDLIIDSERKYHLNNDYTAKKDKEALSELLEDYLDRPFDEKISFFAIKNASGASELIAHQVKKVYKEKIVGSISGDDFSIFITKNSSSTVEILKEINSMHKNTVKSNVK